MKAFTEDKLKSSVIIELTSQAPQFYILRKLQKWVGFQVTIIFSRLVSMNLVLIILFYLVNIWAPAVHLKVKVTQWCPTLFDPMDYSMDSSSPWNSLGQNTGVGSLSLLQGIFQTQESNPGLLHCRWILYQLRHQGSYMYDTSKIYLLIICSCGSGNGKNALISFQKCDWNRTSRPVIRGRKCADVLLCANHPDQLALSAAPEGQYFFP